MARAFPTGVGWMRGLTLLRTVRSEQTDKHPNARPGPSCCPPDDIHLNGKLLLITCVQTGFVPS